jgi:hypothetical protein
VAEGMVTVGRLFCHFKAYERYYRGRGIGKVIKSIGNYRNGQRYDAKSYFNTRKENIYNDSDNRGKGAKARSNLRVFWVIISLYKYS